MSILNWLLERNTRRAWSNFERAREQARKIPALALRMDVDSRQHFIGKPFAKNRAAQKPAA